MKLKGISSFRKDSRHMRDGFTNLGYQYYKYGVLNKVLSREMFSNPVQDSNYRQIERLIIYLIDMVKQIRTQYSVAHDKETIYIN